MLKVPFNKPYYAGKEFDYIKTAIDNMQISGDGLYTHKCHYFIEQIFGIIKALLTTSCTHALEMAALLFDVKPGDEVILPSYTFVSTANAFVLRGAKPVFVDIRSDTLNIDESKIEEEITSKTKVICPVHYAGISCEMDKIMEIANQNNLFVVEDAAQGMNAKYKGKHLGSIGHLGAYSFHETKNYICGEGGALLINDPRFIERAEIIREKGTNRNKYFRGEIDKYTWVDKGSSYLLSDILAAFLYAQFEQLSEITNKRRMVFEYYYNSLMDLEYKGLIKLPFYSNDNVAPNYHMFYIILESKNKRDKVITGLLDKGIQAIFHYVPLHTSPMGKKFGYDRGDLPVTENLSERLIRLPFYNELSQIDQEYVINNLRKLV